MLLIAPKATYVVMIFNQGARISEEFSNEALSKIHINNITINNVQI